MGSSQSIKINNKLTLRRKPLKINHKGLKKSSTNHTLIRIAIKNSRSYFISVYLKGLKLVEKGSVLWELYDKEKLNLLELLDDVKYITRHNCYLICCAGAWVYRKDVSKSPLCLIFHTGSKTLGSRLGEYLQYSETLDRVILIRSYKECLIFNISTRKIEFCIKPNFFGLFQDYQLFGAQKDKVLGLTHSGLMVLYNLASNPPKITQKYKIKKLTIRDETAGPGLTVCRKNQYAVTQLRSLDYIPPESTGIVIFLLQDEVRLVLVAQIASFNLLEYPLFIRKFFILNFGQNSENCLIFFGENFDDKMSKIEFIEFGLSTGELSRVDVGEKRALKSKFERQIFRAHTDNFYQISGNFELFQLEFEHKSTV